MTEITATTEAGTSVTVIDPQQGGALVQSTVNFADFAEDAGAGSEDMGIKDVALPHFSILQSNSPQVDEANTAKFNPNAAKGMIFNNVTGALIDGKKGLVVIRVAYEMELVEWKPRDSGGGLAGRHPINSPILKQAKPNDMGKLLLPNGNVLDETAYHYVLTENGEAGVVPMKSTQLKYSKRWNTEIMGKTMEQDGKTIKLPHFAQVYRLTTWADKNTKGSFYSWKTEYLGTIQEKAQYDAAKEYRSAVTAGLLKAAVPEPDNSAPLNDDDAPF